MQTTAVATKISSAELTIFEKLSAAFSSDEILEFRRSGIEACQTEDESVQKYDVRLIESRIADKQHGGMFELDAPYALELGYRDHEDVFHPLACCAFECAANRPGHDLPPSRLRILQFMYNLKGTESEQIRNEMICMPWVAALIGIAGLLARALAYRKLMIRAAEYTDSYRNMIDAYPEHERASLMEHNDYLVLWHNRMAELLGFAYEVPWYTRTLDTAS